MEEKVVFDDSNFNNLELVRQVVLRRLREDSTWSHLDYGGDGFDRYVTFPHSRLKGRFAVLANEVMWELIIQGVITPGMNPPNPTLPFFRITDYGQKVLAEERFVPHDPAGYISEIRTVARSCIGPVVFAYLEEALQCFTRGCHVASMLLLGVAAEAAFLGLCKVIRASLRDANTKQAFDKLPDLIRPKHRWIMEKYHALPLRVRREQLPESLDMTLGSLYELIRRQRNELGHPQESPPRLNRDYVFVAFRLFPTYVSDLEAFAAFCTSNGL